jgi:hypothetical protein
VSESQEPTGALLIGSIPLRDAEEVFRTLSTTLGSRLRRLPDGETGPRGLFAGWQVQVFERHPDFEAVPGRRLVQVVKPHQLRVGVDPRDVRFTNLGFAQAVLESWATFRRLKAEGAIPPHVRFQVRLPTPVNCLAMVLKPSDIPQVEAAS